MKTSDAPDVALFLLRSLARAGESLDKFEEALEDWRRWSEDARSVPEFEHILSSMLKPGDDQAAMADTAATEIQQLYAKSFFLMNETGTITSISQELSSTLNLKKGDVIAQARADSLFTTVSDGGSESHAPGHLIVTDRYNIERIVVIFPPSNRGENKNQIFAALVQPTFGSDASIYLTQRKGLTPAELEIFQAALRRYRPEQIAELKSISLNTVRTHISRLNNKLGCRSLNESLALAVELELFLRLRQLRLEDLVSDVQNQGRNVTLPDGEARIEFRRYGNVSGRPMVVLHSGEYGFVPSESFAAEARRRGICLYFPLRPGFGSSSKAQSLDQAARMLSGFIEAMSLTDVTLVALSTAAPTALRIADPRLRLSRTVLVNYALNTPSKIEYIQPRWMQGFISMALESPVAFRMAMNAARDILKKSGAQSFYRSLYEGFTEDRQFLKKNEDLFNTYSVYFTGADHYCLMLDVIYSFTKQRNIDMLSQSHRALMVVNGDNQYLVPNDYAREEAISLGAKFYGIERGGRNWLFSHPEKFFELLEQAELHDEPRRHII